MTLQEYLARMLQDLQLRGMAKPTQDNYVRSVRKISEHYNKLPDQITEEQIREYFLYLKNVRKFGRSASTLAMCGLKFFYTYTLKRDWPTLTLIRAPHEQKLPTVLTQSQVKKILTSIRIFRHRACLTMIYSCGLRINEAVHVKVGDIDSEHIILHVKYGNNGRHLSSVRQSLPGEIWRSHVNFS